MTVTSFGGHPGVKGNGHVPYYMVFDHTGKLRRQHMGGAYHGGDGLEMIEWVDRLLKETPAIWLGNEPFQHLADLIVPQQFFLPDARPHVQHQHVRRRVEQSAVEIKQDGTIAVRIGHVDGRAVK